MVAGLDLTVTRATTTTSLTSSRNPSAVLRPVTFTATVDGVRAGGTVTFSACGVKIGSPVPLEDGQATSRPVSILPPGTTTLTAT